MRITLDSLASQVSLSPGYLSRLFKKEMGMSVSEYISVQKIETAKNMLRYSDYSPSFIASILGYPSQSYFTQCFKKATGVTPKRFI
jgi:YesN/AraC family two-component response regulator